MQPGIRWCPHCGQPHKLSDSLCANTGKSVAGAIHTTPERQHPFLGQVLLQRYRLDRVIGSGGLGVVFEGHDMLLSRSAAVKICNDARSRTATMRLAQEAHFLSRLRHPNIVDVYNFAVVPEAGPVLVMEKLDGDTLGERMRRAGRMRAIEAVEMIVQCLSAVRMAHVAGIVHRDLKPNNVFVVDRVGCAPLPKLLDFGLAKEIESHRRLTLPGKAPGSAGYMAPEYARFGKVTPGTDIFALGVILFELVTGQHPFATGEGGRLRPDRPPLDLSATRANVGDPLRHVIYRAIELDERARFADAATFQEALLTSLTPTDYFEDDEDTASSTSPNLRR